MRQQIPDGITTFEEFWPYYVQEHLNRICRFLHVSGMVGALTIIVWSVVTRHYYCVLLAPIFGYALAWIGHFVFERNRPATFRYPRFSLLGDFVMTYKILTRQMQSPKNLGRRAGD